MIAQCYTQYAHDFNKTSEDHWCLKPGQVLKTSGFTLQFASEALRCNREAGIMLISLFCVSIDDEDNTRMMRMVMIVVIMMVMMIMAIMMITVITMVIVIVIVTAIVD